MPDPVALGQPTVGEAELAAVARVFASGWLSGAGPTCAAFEQRFSRGLRGGARAGHLQLRQRPAPGAAGAGRRAR